MIYLIAILISLALFGAFLLLTAFERMLGKRLLAGGRSVLDSRVSRASFVLRHVDWIAFLKHASTVIFERVAHDLAHGALLIIRLLERLLTRTVRTLRERQLGASPVKPTEKKSLLEKARNSFRRALNRAQAWKKQVPAKAPETKENL